MLDALRRCLQIVDARYKTMQRQGQREFTGSHIYVFIEEMADLLTMRSTKQEAEELMQRIAQIGRAARVHVIGATQHIPTVANTQSGNLPYAATLTLALP